MKRSFLLYALLLSAFCLADIAYCQRTTRRHLKPIPVGRVADGIDTIFTAADSAMFKFSGYEKTLRSSKESFYITNSSDSVISGVVVSIEYLDLKGRQLDKRTATIRLELAPGDTRRADLRAWDSQKVMYYYRSPKPRVAQATPYKVRIAFVAAIKD